MIFADTDLVSDYMLYIGNDEYQQEKANLTLLFFTNPCSLLIVSAIYIQVVLTVGVKLH